MHKNRSSTPAADEQASANTSEMTRKIASDVSVAETDSDGNNLSAEQIEFFKNSVGRDENGKLMPMYHGTQNDGFTVFDAKKARSNGHYGSGFYFSSTPLTAEVRKSLKKLK